MQLHLVTPRSLLVSLVNDGPGRVYRANPTMCRLSMVWPDFKLDNAMMLIQDV